MPTSTETNSPGSRRPRRRRRGAATVELAVCLPAIILLVMGAIEATSMIFMRQAMVQAAYETAKESVRRGGSQASGLTAGNEVLAARSIVDASINFQPGNVGNAPRGAPVTVSISAPGDTNTILPFGPFAGITVNVQATMIKES